MSKKNILVCGGRNFTDQCMVDSVLDWSSIRGDIRIINGGAKGADACATRYAKENNHLYKEYKADWAVNGRAAGPLRNREMLREEDISLVIAFPGGKGTADMIRQARAKGIEVLEIRYE